MKNLENQLKSYLTFLTIIGAFPLSIEKELARSTFLKLYGVTILAIQIGAGAYVTTKELPQSGFAGFTIRSLPAVGILIIAASTAMPIINSNVICDIFKRFNKVDRYFQDLGILKNPRSNVWQAWGIAFFHFVISAIIIITEFVFPYWIIQITYYAMYLMWIVSVMSFVMINIGTYTKLIRERYRVINEELENIEKEVQVTRGLFANKMNIYYLRPANNRYENVERELFPPNINRIHQLTKNLKMYQDPNKNLVTRIKKLQKSHFELSIICGNLGAVFTPSIVLTILFTGAELLITSYTVFKMVIYREIVMIALWTGVKFVLMDFYRVISILRSFSETEKEANSTPSHVHAILLEIEHAEAQKQLIKFSQQLSHQKVSFSTCGLFTLDMGLLASMTGAITTYLVILLQYDSSSKTQQ